MSEYEIYKYVVNCKNVVIINLNRDVETCLMYVYI